MTTQPTAVRRPRGGLLREHDFRQLWIGDTISQVGTQLTGLAMPVLAVTVLHADEFQMGLLGTFEFLAFLVIGLPAGAWVDRWRKKRVLVTNDLVRAVALGSLPLAWAMGVLTLVQLLVVALVVGSCTVFFDVAYQSYLPEIVEPELIGEGNAKLQASQSVAQIGGPALAGLMIRVIGSPLTIGLDALSFLASAFSIGRIRHPDTPPAREDRRPLHVEIAEGLRFVVGHPLLWRITACTSIGNFFGSLGGPLLVLYALRQLHLDTGQVGVVFAIGAAGGLLGALGTTRISRVVGEGRTVVISAVLWTLPLALVPLASVALPALPALAASMFFASFMVVVYNVTQVSFRQRLCPRPLLGRMNASIRFLVWGVMPIASFVGGAVAQATTIRTVLWIGVGGTFLATLPVLFSPLATMRELPSSLDRLTGS